MVVRCWHETIEITIKMAWSPKGSFMPLSVDDIFYTPMRLMGAGYKHLAYDSAIFCASKNQGNEVFKSKMLVLCQAKRGVFRVLFYLVEEKNSVTLL